MSIKLFARALPAVAGLLVCASSRGVGQGISHAHRPGIGYTIHVTSTPHAGSGGSGVLAGGAQNYVGRAVFAVNRGRMDIVDGAVESLFSKGDYVLFDSTDLVIVHPAS